MGRLVERTADAKEQGVLPSAALFCLCKALVTGDPGNAGIDDWTAGFLAGEMAESWERRFGEPRWAKLILWADGLDVMGEVLCRAEQRPGLESLLEIAKPSIN